MPWLLAAISAIAFVLALWLMRGADPLNPDTPSYLYFDPSRTIGYPAFLWLAKALTGHASAAIPAQMAILAASLFLLGWSFHGAVGRARLSLVFQLFLVCSPDLWRSSGQLMTESLATAAVALWCAQLLRQLKRPSLEGSSLLAIISAAGTLVRPSLLVLFAGTGVAILLLGGARARRAAALGTIGISIGTLLITPAAYLFIHGSATTTSPFARGVLQHTLFCTVDPPDDPDALLVDQESFAARRYVESAPADVRNGLEHLSSAPLRFDSIIPQLGRLHGFRAGWQTDPIVARVARERVEAAPLCYGASVLRSYWELVTQNSIHVGSAGRAVDEFLASHPPVLIAATPPLAVDREALDKAAAELRLPAPSPHLAIGHFAARSSPLLLLLGRLLYGSAAAIGLFSAAYLLRRRGAVSRDVICVAAMGIGFHALFAATAIVELALIRYTLPAWPMVCTMLALTFAIVRAAIQPSATSSILGTHSAHQMAPSAAMAEVR